MTKFGHKRGAMLMVPIVAPLLFAGCVEQSKYDALEAQYQQLQQEHQQLQQQSGQQQARIGRLAEAIKYTVNSDLAFAPGSWKLSPQGEDIITKITSKLGPLQEAHIVVNGYTDNTPIGAGLKAKGVDSNDALSQKRAEAVMEFIVSKGGQPSLLSAVGHGEADPVASNDTREGRAQNRRVELAVGGS